MDEEARVARVCARRGRQGWWWRSEANTVRPGDGGAAQRRREHSEARGAGLGGAAVRALAEKARAAAWEARAAVENGVAALRRDRAEKMARAGADEEKRSRTKAYMRTQIRSARTDRTRWSNDRTRWCSVRSHSSKLLERPDASG
jgi:leucyl aminopeptidase (aminopeptidase T)